MAQRLRKAAAPEWTQTPEQHTAIIKVEFKAAMQDAASSARTKMVHERIAELCAEGGDPHHDLELDWEEELSQFKDLAYPEYYRQPFHSVPNGWLSTRAATKNRVAMQVR